MKHKPFSKRYVHQKPLTTRFLNWLATPQRTALPRLGSTRKHWKIMIFGLILIWLMTGLLHPFGPIVPLVHADFNTTFAHTRTSIEGCTASSGCFTTSRWNYNSTCVADNPGGGADVLDFSYSTGSSGTGGNNCASASIAVLKTPINLQTISGKQLELFMDLRNLANTNTRLVTYNLILRTNGTLPSFTENWNSKVSDDPAVRYMWAICPSNLGCNAGNGQMDTYITHTDTGTVNNEGAANIDILSGNAKCAFGNDCIYQEVLNFTGPINFYFSADSVSGFTSSTSQNAASNLQQGRDYYVFLFVNWNTATTPTGSTTVRFLSGITAAGITTSWAINSVPSSCNDVQAGNQKLAACGALGVAVPSFDINPLDPSSWANAIIKGLVWAATEALKAILKFLGTLVTALVTALDLLGDFFGFGKIGTAMLKFFLDVGSFVTNLILGPNGIFTQAANLITFFINGITALSNIWTLFFGQILGFLTAVGTVLAFFGTVWNAFFVFGVPSANLMVFFDYTYGMWKVYEEGTSGLMEWVDFNTKMVLLVWHTTDQFYDLSIKTILRIKGLLHPMASSS